VGLQRFASPSGKRPGGGGRKRGGLGGHGGRSEQDIWRNEKCQLTKRSNDHRSKALREKLRNEACQRLFAQSHGNISSGRTSGGEEGPLGQGTKGKNRHRNDSAIESGNKKTKGKKGKDSLRKCGLLTEERKIGQYVGSSIRDQKLSPAICKDKGACLVY